MPSCRQCMCMMLLAVFCSPVGFSQKPRIILEGKVFIEVKDKKEEIPYVVTTPVRGHEYTITLDQTNTTMTILSDPTAEIGGLLFDNSALQTRLDDVFTTLKLGESDWIDVTARLNSEKARVFRVRTKVNDAQVTVLFDEQRVAGPADVKLISVAQLKSQLLTRVVEHLRESMAQRITKKLNQLYPMREYEVPTAVGEEVALVHLSSTAARYIEKQDVTTRRSSYFQTDDLDITEDSVQLDHVELVIRDGMLMTVIVSGQVGSDNYIFTNDAPMPINTITQFEYLNTPKYYQLRQVAGPRPPNKSHYLDLSKVLQFIPKAMVDGNNIPKDGRYILDRNSGGQAELVLKKASIWDNIDIRLYSDLIGVESGKPNGALQAEGRYTFMWNSLPKRNTLLVNALGFIPAAVSLAFAAKAWDDGRIAMSNACLAGSLVSALFPGFTNIFLPYSRYVEKVSPFVAFQHLEESNPIKPVLVSDSRTGELQDLQVRSLDLVRKASITSGLEFTLLHSTWPEVNLDIQLVVGTGLSVATLDTTALQVKMLRAQNSPRTDLWSMYLSPELVFRTISTNSVAFDIRYGLVGYYPFSDYLSPSSPYPITYLDDNTYMHKCEINLNFFTDTANRNSWVFLRLRDIIQKSENYYSLMIGYATTITELLPPRP